MSGKETVQGFFGLLHALCILRREQLVLLIASSEDSCLLNPVGFAKEIGSSTGVSTDKGRHTYRTAFPVADILRLPTRGLTVIFVQYIHVTDGLNTVSSL